jgi:hypothetical protein
MTIAMLLGAGFVAGLLLGVAFAEPAYGCAFLLTVSVAMFGYIWWWQSQNPDELRSTSSLDFLFGPLWPSLGAVGGFLAGVLLRTLFQKLR